VIGSENDPALPVRDACHLNPDHRFDHMGEGFCASEKVRPGPNLDM